jgi:AhpD family alkylhydroperoxidase
LEGYLAFNSALGRGVLPAGLREQIAVAVAGANECDYCASAHTALGKGAGVSAEELARNLQGGSADGKTQKALRFVRTVVSKRGHVSDADVLALREAGFNDAEVVEIVAHIGLNMFTNYFNHIADTEIDFPVVRTTPDARAA